MLLQCRNSFNVLRNNLQHISKRHIPKNATIQRRFAANTPSTTVTNGSVNSKSNRTIPSKGPGLKEFLIAGKNLPASSDIVTTAEAIPYLSVADYDGHGRKVFFEVYGCQMNVNDTEVVWAILKKNGYVKVDSAENADVVLLITCAIREKAESKVGITALLMKYAIKSLIIFVVFL